MLAKVIPRAELTPAQRAKNKQMIRIQPEMNWSRTGMRNLIRVIIISLCLVFALPQTHAAPKTKSKPQQQVQKERLVLMPLRLDEADQKLQGVMETALVKGLQQKYEVFSGEQVAQKARQIFLKESRNTAHKECDEIRCLQGIAEAFQAELLATANITKQDGGYFIALSIQNLYDNKVVQSESVACEGCNAFKVVEKLKDIVGAQTFVISTPSVEELQPGKVVKDCPDCPEMVVVPAGSFNMGETNAAHRVTIAQPFAMGKTEITQGQWKAVMGTNPSNFKNCGDTCPVEQVSWDDIQEFLQKLNAKTGKQYRLPSEAEWEYACRAGGQNEYCGGDNLDSVGWASPVGNSAKTTNPVATKQANAWGLYDMSGNVLEWCEDSWHDNYSGAPTDGTAWQGDGAMRVLRGGSWDIRPWFARAANRDGSGPVYRFISFGFRLARTLR